MENEHAAVCVVKVSRLALALALAGGLNCGRWLSLSDDEGEKKWCSQRCTRRKQRRPTTSIVDSSLGLIYDRAELAVTSAIYSVTRSAALDERESNILRTN